VTLTDAELVARCRSGEDEAWNELVERFSRYVYAIAVQAFRLPPADAEDVFQEVFARVYEHLDRLRSDDAIRPWIAQLTRRLCIDRLRSAGREAPVEDGDLQFAGIDESLAQLDEAMTVRAASRRWGRPAGRSSTASSAATRATGRSASRSTCRRGRSPRASRAVSRS
jgi:RNA polymerase sigma factor (sigma-70 family)